MKNFLIVFALFVFSCSDLCSQTDTLYKQYKHELGADVTVLFRQIFLSFNNSIDYFPIYHVSYRYHLKKSNIRFGVGGQYYKRETPAYTINGEEKTFANSSSNFSFRFGYEWISELSKKWQAFYGIDFRPSFASQNTQVDFSNAGYLRGNLYSSQTYGVAPLLGFRYRISKRISILTEASCSFNLEKNWTQKTSISTNEQNYPVLNAAKKTRETNFSVNFLPPLFLFLVVDL